MASQALYRRYRPRRFAEVKGQDHVVRALRNAVIHHREGQAYLFSGPRGTGKTTSARILAKVLNCERPVDGEPCCECESCLAVERGTSYDVHELDAASNNGVDAMRDLIEKAALGTPGRHKVYILDEVHMLSKAAEAALLKTLEEPPPHVVFVLATTDPQKVSDTIRSRTQHLQFHLLPMDELDRHVRWVAADAGLQLSEQAIQSVLSQGGGSARDTLSALELAAAVGGEVTDDIHLSEFVEALIEHDPGRALTAVASAAQLGRDARSVADDVVRYLRDCFLSLMAPELVQLPDQRAAEVAELAARLGAAGAVRAMERIGEVLVEMRHAPDPRLLLEVALVQLTHQGSANDVGALLTRVEKLEQALASGAAAVPARPAPVDPTTGRATLGGRARREPPVTITAAAGTATSTSTPSASPASTAPPDPTATPGPTGPPGDADTTAAASTVEPSTSGGSVDRALSVWSSDVLPALKPFVKALYAGAKVLGQRDGGLGLAFPNEAHRAKCEGHRADVEAVLARVAGGPVPLVLVVDHEATADDNVIPLQRSSPRTTSPVVAPDPDEDIDLTELVDVPPESVVGPIDQLKQAFPGSQLVDETPG